MTDDFLSPPTPKDKMLEYSLKLAVLMTAAESGIMAESDNSIA